MPVIRRSRAEQQIIAIDDLLAATAHTAGLTIARTDADDTVRVDAAGRRPWSARVHARANLSSPDARALVAMAGPGAHILVADKIAADAKEHLASTPSWSWLDRRTELRLRHGRHEIEIRLPPGGMQVGSAARTILATPASDSPIRGRAGTSVAAALLLAGAGSAGVRSIARQAGLAPSTVSDAFRHLRDGGYANLDGTPLLPDLFWALADMWAPTKAEPVATVPEPDGLAYLDMNLDDLDRPGWAEGGDDAALAWGAPMFAITRPWLWVPDEATARRAVRVLEPARDWMSAKAIIAVAPTPLACSTRVRAPSGDMPWPTAHPLFLALQLAMDRSRGREILESWEPALLDPVPWRVEP